MYFVYLDAKLCKSLTHDTTQAELEELRKEARIREQNGLNGFNKSGWLDSLAPELSDDSVSWNCFVKAWRYVVGAASDEALAEVRRTVIRQLSNQQKYFDAFNEELALLMSGKFGAQRSRNPTDQEIEAADDLAKDLVRLFSWAFPSKDDLAPDYYQPNVWHSGRLRNLSVSTRKWKTAQLPKEGSKRRRLLGLVLCLRALWTFDRAWRQANHRERVEIRGYLQQAWTERGLVADPNSRGMQPLYLESAVEESLNLIQAVKDEGREVDLFLAANEILKDKPPLLRHFWEELLLLLEERLAQAREPRTWSQTLTSESKSLYSELLKRCRALRKYCNRNPECTVEQVMSEDTRLHANHKPMPDTIASLLLQNNRGDIQPADVAYEWTAIELNERHNLKTTAEAIRSAFKRKRNGDTTKGQPSQSDRQGSN